MSEDELTDALRELQRAEARVDAATRRKIAARIRQYYPTAATLHAYGEYNEDGLLKLRAKSVTDAEGTTLAKYDDDTLHTVDWDDVCDEVDPDLDQLSERDESYLGDVEISLRPEDNQPDKRPRVQVLHQRDPDYECGIRVFLDGVELTHPQVEDMDPGRGYEKEDYERDLESARAAAGREEATDFDRALLDAYEGMQDAYRKWSTDKTW